VRIASVLGEESFHLARLQPGGGSEQGVGADVGVDVAQVWGGPAGALRQCDPVGAALVEHVLHGGGDRPDRLHDPDVGGRRQYPEGLHVAAEEVDLIRGDPLPVGARRAGPFEQRVVDVGDVLDVADLASGVAPGTHQQVVGEVGVGVPEVRRVVRGDAADVEVGRSGGAGGQQSVGRRVEEVDD